ncbi:hypothetical protein K3495_g10836 [Podosphaera aphanis]|nr:hypothetical protein K3495_g10836 [Podosphaera aphanis]
MTESSSQRFWSRVMEKLATKSQPALYFIRGLPVVREDRCKQDMHRPLNDCLLPSLDWGLFILEVYDSNSTNV